MSDVDVNELIRQACRAEVRKAVRLLLEGNDTACFTTEQYIEMRVRLMQKREAGSCSWISDGLHGIRDDGQMIAEHQLSTMAADMVREVRYGVWADTTGEKL